MPSPSGSSRRASGKMMDPNSGEWTHIKLDDFTAFFSDYMQAVYLNKYKNGTFTLCMCSCGPEPTRGGPAGQARRGAPLGAQTAAGHGDARACGDVCHRAFRDAPRPPWLRPENCSGGRQSRAWPSDLPARRPIPSWRRWMVESPGVPAWRWMARSPGSGRSASIPRSRTARSAAGWWWLGKCDGGAHRRLLGTGRVPGPGARRLHQARVPVREPFTLLDELARSGPRRRGYVVRTADGQRHRPLDRLCRRAHGHGRRPETLAAIRRGGDPRREKRPSHGLTTRIGLRGHAVARSNGSLKRLIAAFHGPEPPGFLVPTRNTALVRWCLELGFASSCR